MTINRHPAVVAPVAGLLLGVLDFLLIKYVPFPLGGLGNSPAVWAVAAFLLTFGTRWSPLASVAGAVVFLAVAVPSYYLTAMLIQHDDPANMYNATALLWIGFGVVAGVVFGGGGAVARTAGRLRTAARAGPAAVLLAEAALQLGRLGDPSYRVADTLQYGGVLLLLSLLTVALVARTWPARGRTLAVAAPLAAAGAGLMVAVGFG